MTTAANACANNAEQQIAYLEKCRNSLIEESKKPVNAGRVEDFQAHIQDLNKRITAARAAHQAIQPIIQATPPAASRLWSPDSSPKPRPMTAQEQTGDPP